MSSTATDSPALAVHHVRPGRGRELEIVEPGQDTPFEVLKFDALYNRAEFGEHRVRRRHFLSSDLWLMAPEGGVLAVAVKVNSLLGLCYRLEWAGCVFDLLGSRDELLWQVLESDRIIGEVRALPSDRRERQVELPASTPDEVLCFLVALSEMVRHNPALRLLDRALRSYNWST